MSQLPGNRQHDLAGVRARFHQRVRFGGLRQRESRTHDRLDPAAADERPDFFLEFLRDACFERAAVLAEV